MQCIADKMFVILSSVAISAKLSVSMFIRHIRYQLPHQCVSLFKALTYPHANVHKTLQTHCR
ncbi:hypothetical protein NP493_255g03046 [Ridgeia piscesae]|uniref:Uncharacterized protein n=1 Tax=Ridgeia piscesae TaxID=27915 RepID=A0AAD9UCS8_RIDPI|nr:hypothetical protein NP493_255g03046 [Ridgeia piscesae]